MKYVKTNKGISTTHNQTFCKLERERERERERDKLELSNDDRKCHSKLVLLLSKHFWVEENQ
jgi:hypothetical protein